jgi:MoxR-like ATPase
MLKVSMGAPDRASELQLAQRMLGADAPEATLAAGSVQAVIAADDLAQVRHALEGVTVREELTAYVVDVVRATRQNDSVLVGAGPRATQSLLLASRANAALAGRDFVTPDDVRGMCEPVLGHRLVLRPEYEIEGTTIGEVIAKILEQVAVPR